MNSNRSTAPLIASTRTEKLFIGVSGEVIKSYSKDEIYNPAYKRGWERAYMANLFKILHECNGKIESMVIEEIINSVSTIDFQVIVHPTEISKKIKCSVESVKKTVRKLKKLGYLRGKRSPYKADPFVVIRYGTSQKVIAEAQKEWTQNDKK